MPMIACLGDSLTQHIVNVAPRIPWPQRVEFDLHTNGSFGSSWQVANHGVTGEKVAAIKTRWTNNVKGKGYKGLILQGGFNNIINDTTTAADIWTDLQFILDEARVEPGMTYVVVMTMSPFKNHASWTSGNQTRLETVNTSIRDYVTSYPSAVKLIDAYALMGDGGDATALSSDYDDEDTDGLHWNQAGVDFIAGQVTTKITTW